MSNKQEYKEHPDAEWERSGEYINKCKKCGRKNSVFSQQDSFPEYYTDVYTRCTHCEELVGFSIAVN